MAALCFKTHTKGGHMIVKSSLKTIAIVNFALSLALIDTGKVVDGIKLAFNISRTS